MSSFLSRLGQAYSPVNNLRQLFIRPESNFSALDGLRALSILCVIVFHTFTGVDFVGGLPLLNDVVQKTPQWMYWIWQGPLGVDIFFVLSGFLMGTMLLREIDKTQRVNFKVFYWRRFLRLTPVYWFSIALIQFLFVNEQGERIFTFDKAWHLYLYIQNFFPQKDNFMIWTWSLAVEEQFYLVVPAFLLLFYRNVRSPLTIFLLLFIVSFGIRWGVIADSDYFLEWRETGTQITKLSLLGAQRYYETLYDNLYTHFGPLLVGIMVAEIKLKHGEKVERFFRNQMLANLLFALSVLTVLFIFNYKMPDPFADYSQPFNLFMLVSFHNIFALGIGFIVLACAFPNQFTQFFTGFLKWRFWYPIAQLSYSLYLFHALVVGVVMVGLKPMLSAIAAEQGLQLWHIFALALLVTAISCVIATITYLLIEKPFMNLRGKPVTSTAITEKQ
ncbi:MAG TPA: acyltransferase [Pseudomonadales bacterium]|nr:acyltransferase [Pseudomonadales bacterium]